MSSTEQEHALALLSEFTLFPSLAPELRLKIFKHALPSSPIRHRLLRVTAEYSTEKPLFKNEGFLKFRLLDNLHSASVKDIAFLSACTESRDVFLSRFKLYLHAGNGGLIRYAEEDVVYIVNLHKLVIKSPILEPSRSHLLIELTMHNLAVPRQMYYHLERSWGHQCQILHNNPPRPSHLPPDVFLPILWLLRNLKVVALVEWDAENLGIRSKEWYSKWVGKKGTQEVTRWLRGSMLRSLMCIRSGWEKAMQEGNKRPAVRSIGVYGTWDILEAQK